MSVADDIMATCGTINLDYRSLYHHFENGCFMADCEVVHEIRDDFIRLFTESTEVTEKYRTEEVQDEGWGSQLCGCLQGYCRLKIMCIREVRAYE